MRLFIALLLEEHALARLYDGVTALKRASLQGNFTHKQNLHLTLAFLGETNRVGEIKSAMTETDASPFRLCIDRLGSFHRAGGDLYWAGLQKSSSLTSLQSGLSRLLLQRGFTLEEREYRPHLTLGRQVLLPESFQKRQWEAQYLPIETSVTNISLMQSQRIAGRLVYSPLYEKPLVCVKGDDTSPSISSKP